MKKQQLREPEPRIKNDLQLDNDRRKLLKKTGGLAATVALVSSQLPKKWQSPVVNSVILPAHAQTSPPATGTPPVLTLSAAGELAEPGDTIEFVVQASSPVTQDIDIALPLVLRELSPSDLPGVSPPTPVEVPFMPSGRLTAGTSEVRLQVSVNTVVQDLPAGFRPNYLEARLVEDDAYILADAPQDQIAEVRLLITPRTLEMLTTPPPTPAPPEVVWVQAVSTNVLVSEPAEFFLERVPVIFPSSLPALTVDLRLHLPEDHELGPVFNTTATFMDGQTETLSFGFGGSEMPFNDGDTVRLEVLDGGERYGLSDDPDEPSSVTVTFSNAFP